MSITVSPTSNRITTSGYTYDSSGNLTQTPSPGSLTMTYDAEGKMTSVAGVTYTYDGDGIRVKKSSGTLYWYGVEGDLLAETDTSGNTTYENIFLGGSRIARRDSSGNVYYYFPDHLGSTRVITNATGSPCYDADFYPYGGERKYSETCPQPLKFGTYERDSESGYYYAFARYCDASLGRFTSPDPLGGDVGNPQSHNGYAYVLNNPTNLIDPLGLTGDCFFAGCPGDPGPPPCIINCGPPFPPCFFGCAPPPEPPTRPRPGPHPGPTHVPPPIHMPYGAGGNNITATAQDATVLTGGWVICNGHGCL